MSNDAAKYSFIAYNKDYVSRAAADYGSTFKVESADLTTKGLSDMKGGELDDALAAGGAELAHDLDSSAMNKLPAKKIVNNSANN